MIDLPVILATLASGAAIGLILGLVGGGGSILAVPLLVHVVGVRSPHVAIGTAAVAVALNALAGLVGHAHAGTVKWRCGAVFAGSGVAGALTGAALGKAFDGQRLLLLFGALMIGVGLSMLRKRRAMPAPDVRLTRDSAAELLPRLVPIGLGVGLISGFFGIGGGFLIVPGLVAATAMPLVNAIGTSLVAISAFGLSTAGSYAASGLVDWVLVALLVAGGVVGSAFGIWVGRRLADRKRALELGFSAVVIAVGAYVMVKAGIAVTAH
jgi:uncharacterized membrane protein YfcA